MPPTQLPLRVLLLSASVLLMPFTPVQAQQDRHRPDGGVWDQPHRPPATLTANDVDVLMWPIVQRINRSGWVWTTESCQGHDNGYPPVLGLVTNDVGKLSRLLADAILQEGRESGVSGESQDPRGVQLTVAYFVEPRVKLGRYQVRLIGRQGDVTRVRRVWVILGERVTR